MMNSTFHLAFHLGGKSWGSESVVSLGIMSLKVDKSQKSQKSQTCILDGPLQQEPIHLLKASSETSILPVYLKNIRETLSNSAPRTFWFPAQTMQSSRLDTATLLDL